MILPGSSIPQVYIDRNVDFAEIQRIGRAVREAAATHILTHDERPTTNDPTDKRSVVDGHSSFVVFNSLPWDRHECAEIPLSADTDAPPDGAQIVEGADGTRIALVETSLPAYSYTTLSTSDHRPATTDVSSHSSLVTRHSSLSCAASYRTSCPST